MKKPYNTNGLIENLFKKIKETENISIMEITPIPFAQGTSWVDTNHSGL